MYEDMPIVAFYRTPVVKFITVTPWNIHNVIYKKKNNILQPNILHYSLIPKGRYRMFRTQIGYVFPACLK